MMNSPQPAPPHPQKALLRQEYKRRRRDLAPEAARAAGVEITRRLLETPALLNARMVFAYIPLPNEAETRGAIRALLHAGVQVVTPPVDTAHDLRTTVHFLHPGDPALEIPTPRPIFTPDTTGALMPADIDVFLVPGIVWDVSGHRIGFGGGYFDWLLNQARADALTVGLAYDWQIVPAVPSDPWDVPVARIITDARTIVCRSPNA